MRKFIHYTIAQFKVMIKYILVFCSTLLLAGSSLGQSAKKEQKRPNIVFIFSDDHALKAIGAYGSTINETPNIDKLAKEGMLFHHAMVTNSICGPSRAVILTGKYSHINGMATNGHDVRFNGAQMTFPKLLREAGYQTAVVGKWHLNSDPTGFDFWKVLPGQGEYYNPDFLTPKGRERLPGYVTNIITNESLQWLEARDKDKPFLLMVQHKAPHRSWLPAPEHLNDYNDKTFPEPATLFDTYDGRASAARNQKMEIGRDMNLFADNKVFAIRKNQQDNPDGQYGRMTPEQRQQMEEAYRAENEAFLKKRPEGKELVRWKYQRYMKDYLRSVASVDESVGEVLDYLKKADLEENTIVVYSSDQGFYLGEHGWFDKRWMYEESLHTPLVVRWPGVVKPGAQNRDMVLNLDFGETLLDAAGIKIPEEMQGKSLVPLLKGQTPKDWRKEVYYHYVESERPHFVAKHFGIRTEGHKLIYYYELGEWELFDLKLDPQEIKSRYNDPAYAGVVKDLKAKLKKLQQEYKDPVVDKVKY